MLLNELVVFPEDAFECIFAYSGELHVIQNVVAVSFWHKRLKLFLLQICWKHEPFLDTIERALESSNWRSVEAQHSCQSCWPQSTHAIPFYKCLHLVPDCWCIHVTHGRASRFYPRQTYIMACIWILKKLFTIWLLGAFTNLKKSQDEFQGKSLKNQKNPR